MRLLMVGLPRSPHTIRHLNALADASLDVHFAPSIEAAPIDGLCRGVRVHLMPHRRRGWARLGGSSVDLSDPVRRSLARWSYRAARFGLPSRRHQWEPGPLARLPAEHRPPVAVLGIDLATALEKVGQDFLARPVWLANLIDDLRPDIVTSGTIAQAGYMTLAARSLCRRPFPRWVVGCWGLDLDLLVGLPEHRDPIRRVLAECGALYAECHRDIALARGLGFAGAVLGVEPIGGGWDLDHVRGLRSPGPTSGRRVLMVKGYQDFVGRAFVALRAVALAADALRGWRVLIFASGAGTDIAARLLAEETGLEVEVLPRLPYDDLLRHLGTARIGLALSASDAISTSALESMIMGAFPIQSATSCLGEWIRDGASGFLVPAEDPEAVAAAIRRAACDDALVDHAAAENDRVAAERLEARVVNPRIAAMYRRALDGDEPSGPVNAAETRGISR